HLPERHTKPGKDPPKGRNCDNKHRDSGARQPEGSGRQHPEKYRPLLINIAPTAARRRFRNLWALSNLATGMAKTIAETPLMKQHKEIKSRYPDAVLLFRVGDFYETFAE